jgi:hypothetical protein
MRILGVTASSFFKGGDFELISTTILPSAQASVVFDVSSFSSTYKHLQIRATMRSTRGGSDSLYYIRFNGDSGSNYQAHFLRGTGSAVNSESPTASYPSGIVVYGGLPSTDTTGNYGGNVIDILDSFSTTKNTTTRALVGQAAAFNRVALESGAWFNTASITSITLTDVFANFSIGSRFSIYGVK